jgi:hypothetical protein
MSIFGAAELGARLPAIVGFFLGSMGLFLFIARRAGALWAAAGVGLFWYNQFFYFATEARPYGVLLAFFGLTLVSWDYLAGTSHRSRRPWALAGVAVGATGMLLTHVYAVLWIMPFWIAELVRGGRSGKTDWPLWAALVFPLVACLTYVPLVKNVSMAVFPPMFQGSAPRTLMFYLTVFFQASPPLAAGSLAAFGVAVWRRQERRAVTTHRAVKAAALEAPELAFFAASLLPPALLNALSVYRHIAFYDRHAILTVLTVNLLIMLFIAHETHSSRISGMMAAVVILGFTVFLPGVGLARETPPAKAGSPALQDIYRIHPELPLVANSALTFLEIDHYEEPALLSRLYYLVDPASSIKYTHSTMTEGLLVMKQYFPIRANVSPYADFVAAHRHFLVWGVMDQQGWLLRKLKTEGALVTELGKFDTPYADSQLSEVWLVP